jgi:hypothetical protein
MGIGAGTDHHGHAPGFSQACKGQFMPQCEELNSGRFGRFKHW